MVGDATPTVPPPEARPRQVGARGGFGFGFLAGVLVTAASLVVPTILVGGIRFDLGYGDGYSIGRAVAVGALEAEFGCLDECPECTHVLALGSLGVAVVEVDGVKTVRRLP